MIDGYRGGYFVKVPTPTPTGCELQVHFKKYPSMCPLHNLWVNDGYFQKEPSKVPTGHFVKELRFLSQNTQWCDHKVSSGFFSKNSQQTHNSAWFYYELSKNSSKNPLDMLWSHHWVFCERNLRFLSQSGQWVLEPPQRGGLAARGFVEMPRIPPRQRQGSNRG